MIPSPTRGFDWEAAGRELGETFGAYHAIVVVGMDPVATGRVAVGIARGQSFKRRVAVGDLFAESPPIQALVMSDDPHGLVDSFLYGVSLSRIAHEVADSGQLFVMPSGTEPPDYNEILPNKRWLRLTAGFREVGALLVLAAPASAPHVEDLVAVMDGAVLVGEAVPRQIPVARIIASVRSQGQTAAVERGTPGPAPGVGRAKTAKEPSDAADQRPRRRGFGGRIAAVAGLVFSLAILGGGAWFFYHPYFWSPPHARVTPDTTKGLGTVIAPPATDTALRDSRPDTVGVTAVTPAGLTVANPGDSASAAAFAVELSIGNTVAGAILKLQQDGKKLPAATFSPVNLPAGRWFKFVCGAYASRAEADSLLAGLRQHGMLPAATGSVVKLPYAFLIDSAVSAAAVVGLLASYADQGKPVYALRQANGTAWLLAGAFESLEQSSLYTESIRSWGSAPVLVYRKGRPF